MIVALDSNPVDKSRFVRRCYLIVPSHVLERGARERREPVSPKESL